jgi:serine/threonine protein kinase
LERSKQRIREERQRTWPQLYTWAEKETKKMRQAVIELISALGYLEKDWPQHETQKHTTKEGQVGKAKEEGEGERKEREQVREEDIERELEGKVLKFKVEERCTKEGTRDKEFSWSFNATWELFLDETPIFSRTGEHVIYTPNDRTPRPKCSVKPPLVLPVAWLFQNKKFSIRQTDPRCKTPRHNPEIEQAMLVAREISEFCKKVYEHFMNGLFLLERDQGFDLTVISLQHSIADHSEFIRKFREIGEHFQDARKLISAAELRLVLCTLRTMEVIYYFLEEMNHVDEELRTSVISAIGKEITPAEFSECMNFFSGDLASQFMRWVRVPMKSPVGAVTIEGNPGDLISTISRKIKISEPIVLRIEASTQASITPKCRVHGWIRYRFSGDSGLPSEKLTLTARAKNFSSFFLFLGRIKPGNAFDPSVAIIVKNSEKLKIPLNLETIPPPKDFRDAIHSLSPEHRRFASAFRSMQLESTLFGILTIPIKPQLEKVLNLRSGDLAKEFRLAEDAQHLLLEYQVPTGMLSAEDSGVETVRESVRSTETFINEMKEAELRSRQMETEFRKKSEKKKQVQTCGSCFLVKTHYTFQTSDKFYVIMDFINGGEFLFHMRPKQTRPEIIKFYAAEILLALEYLHSKKIIFGTFSPNKIFLSSDGHVRLTGAGMSMAGFEPLDESVATFGTGEPEYLAPEVLRGDCYDSAADWWGFGIFLFEMFTGIPPFYSENPETMYRKIITEPVPATPLPPDVRSLVVQLLEKNPKNRLADPAEIKSHEFFLAIDWSTFELPNSETQKRKSPTPSGAEKFQPVSLDDFQLLKVIGRGHWGKVFMVRKIRSGEIFAMKVFTKKIIIFRNEIEHTRSEKSVLCSLEQNSVPARITPPFIPAVKGADDCCNIDSEFTSEVPVLETPKISKNPEKTTTSKPEPKKLSQQKTHDSEIPQIPDFDFASLPGKLDRALQEQDSSNSVSPTIITPELPERNAKKKALDLLDALSRSGTLGISEAELHVIVAVTHHFDKSLLNTVVQDNLYPIHEALQATRILCKVLEI